MQELMDGAGLASHATWSTLEQVAALPDDAADEVLVPLGWRPWLVRVVALLAHMRDSETPIARLPGPCMLRAGQWIAGRYGVRSASQTDSVMMPPELAPWLPGDASQAPADGGSRAILPPATTVKLGNPVRLHVRLAGPNGDVPADARVTLGASRTRFDAELEAEWDRGATKGVRVRWDENIPHVEQASAQSVVMERMAAWFAAQPSMSRVELVVEPMVASACWEGLLAEWAVAAAARAGGGAIPQEPKPSAPFIPLVRRPHVSRGRGQLATWTQVPMLFGHVPGKLLLREITYAWRALLQAGTRSSIKPGWDQFEDRTKVQRGAVVHIVGEPIALAWGELAMQLTDDTRGGGGVAYRGGSRRQSAVMSSFSDDAPQRDGTLLRMREVFVQYRSATLVVLQATPSNDDRRTDSDRTCAAYLRGMAGELAELGVPAVVTLPPLPRAAAMASLAHVADAAASHVGSPTADMLLHAMAQVHDTVRGAFAEPGDRREAPHEACIYLGSLDEVNYE